MLKYIIQTYYKNESTNLNLNIPKVQSTALLNECFLSIGFEQLTPIYKNELSERPEYNYVATICMEPKYIFDELLAFRTAAYSSSEIQYCPEHSF